MKQFNALSGAVVYLLGLISSPDALGSDQVNPLKASAGGLSYRITEKAEDGPFAITADTRRIDANSDVIINFQGLTNLSPATPTEEWVRVTNILAKVEQAAAERAALREKLKSININDKEAVATLKKLNQEFDTRITGSFDEWQKALHLQDDDRTFQSIIMGDFDGQTNPRVPFLNLSRWIRKELERLNRNAIDSLNSKSVQVTIQAFHSPVGGTRRAVHVENYDNIPSGELQPIDRTGLRMTPAEQARLAMEVNMAEQAAKSIKEIKNSGAQVGTLTSNLVAGLKTRLSELEQSLKKGPAEWGSNVANGISIQPVEDLAKNGDPNTQKAAAIVVTNIAAIREDLNLVDTTILQIQGFKKGLTAGQYESLSQALFSSTGLIQQIKGLQDSLSGVQKRLTSWPARFKEIESALQVLDSKLTAEQKIALLPPDIKNFIQGLGDTFPTTIALLNNVYGLLNDKGLSEGIQTIADTNLDPIWRDQTDLVTGTVELPRVGLAQGDQMMFKVSSRERGANGQPGRVLSEDAYKVETVLMGFHRKFGASVIFARGLRGDDQEQEWKPNVAAHVNWFYRYRDEASPWHRSWNAVNPGIGLHLASLDQGKESVELGAGLNVTLFDGLILGGAGFNLSNREHPYVFVGLSLLDMLEQAKKLKH